MKQIYNCVIIGCGNIAGNYDKKIPKKITYTHAGSYKILNRTNLIAVCDNKKEILLNFKKKWKVKSIYTDYKKMLKNEKVDIVSICTPTNTHFKILKNVIKFKSVKAIFLEKPSTFKAKETKKIIHESKQIISVNYFRRWNNSFYEFKKNIIEKNLLKIKKIQINYTKGLYVAASHQVDLMRFFFGEPKKFEVIKKYKKINNDLGVDFKLIFNSNIEVFFNHIPDVNYVFFDIQIFLDDNIYNISQRGQRITKYSKIKDNDYNVFFKIEKKLDKETNWKNSILRAVEEIIFNLDNSLVFSSSNLYNAYKNTEICEKIYNHTNNE